MIPHRNRVCTICRGIHETMHCRNYTPSHTFCIGCGRFKPTSANAHASACLSKAIFKPKAIDPNGPDTWHTDRFGITFNAPFKIQTYNQAPELFYNNDDIHSEYNCRAVYTAPTSTEPFAIPGAYNIRFVHAKWFAHTVPIYWKNKLICQVVYNGEQPAIVPAPATEMTESQIQELEAFGFFKLHLHEATTEIKIDSNDRLDATYGIDLKSPRPLKMNGDERQLEFNHRFYPKGFMDVSKTAPQITSNPNDQNVVVKAEETQEVSMDERKPTENPNNDSILDSDDTTDPDDLADANEAGVPLPWKITENILKVQFDFATMADQHAFMSAIHRFGHRVRRRILSNASVSDVHIP